jgi:hypothetical protein
LMVSTISSSCHAHRLFHHPRFWRSTTRDREGNWTSSQFGQSHVSRQSPQRRARPATPLAYSITHN